MSRPVTGRRRRASSAVALAVGGALVLAGCGDDPAISDPDRGGGPIGDPGGEQQLRAPEPGGSQLSHEEMREALEDHFSGATITDSDDVLPGLRDLDTELQRLRVDPQECKQYVVESASPLPDGALMAHAAQQLAGGEDESDAEDADDADDADDVAPGTLEATVYSFADWESAHAHLAGEEDGLQRCDAYTATRPSGDEDEDSPATEVSLETVSVRTQADAGLALTQELTADGDSSHLVAVMLRQGAQVVLVARGQGEEIEDDDVEELVEELQEQAAEVLTDLTGDDLALEDEDDEDDQDEDDGGGDEDGEDDGGNAGEDDAAAEDDDGAAEEDS